MSLPFSIEKEKGLEIMKTIFEQLIKKDSISLNENTEYYYFYAERTSPDVIDFRHKVAIIELNADGDNYDNYDKAIKNINYDKSEDIEIHEGSYIEDDKIYLKGYFHNTDFACDVSYPIFHYDNQYKCFVTKEEDGWDDFTILDLSAYN